MGLMSANELVERLVKLGNMTQALGTPQQQCAQGALGGSSSTNVSDYTSFCKLLGDSSEKLEHDVNKLVLGWSGLTTAALRDAGFSKVLESIEVIVTCTHLICGDSSMCCNVAREEARSSINNLVASLISLIKFLDLDPPETVFRQEAPQRAGAVWEACKSARRVAKSNRAAVKRALLLHVRCIKDIHQEFQDLTEKSKGDTNHAAYTGGGVGDSPVHEPESGSDAWYEMMDDLGQDDELEEEELERLHQLLPIIAKAGRILQNTGMAVGSIDEWYKEEGKDDDVEARIAYIQWLDNLSAGASKLSESANTLGMLLYPPHETQKIAMAVENIKMHCESFVAVFVTVSEDKLPESWTKVASLASDIAQFSLT